MFKIQKPPFSRGVGDADSARRAGRPSHQRTLRSARRPRAGDSRPLLRGRIGRRLSRCTASRESRCSAASRGARPPVSEPEDPHHASIAVWDPRVAGRHRPPDDAEGRHRLSIGLQPDRLAHRHLRRDRHNESAAEKRERRSGPQRAHSTGRSSRSMLRRPKASTRGASAPPCLTAHARVTSVVRFIASRPPEHRVLLEVIEQGSGVPVAGVELRVGRFRVATDDAGTAHVDVPGDAYECVPGSSVTRCCRSTADIAP